MSVRLAWLACLVLVGCATHPGPREELIGRWRSDRATTLAHLEGHPTITPAQRSFLEEHLGELVIEYTEDSVTSYLEGWNATGRYDVVDEGPDFVDLQDDDAPSDETQRRVWVHGDQMTVWVPQIGFHEYFVRLPCSGE